MPIPPVLTHQNSPGVPAANFRIILRGLPLPGRQPTPSGPVLCVVVQLGDGKTEVFSEHAPFYLWAANVEDGLRDEEGLPSLGEPTTPHGWEALRLRHTLENATPESRAKYEARYGGMFVWEESSLLDEG